MIRTFFSTKQANQKFFCTWAGTCDRIPVTDLHFGPNGGQRAANGRARSRSEGTPAAVPMRWHSKYFVGGIFMRRFSVRDITLAAMVAALYALLGYFGDMLSLTFGTVQVRFAEALTVLPFLFPTAAPGLAIGCLITNLLSPYGLMDVIFGTLATAIAAWFTVKMPRWYLAALPPILVNAVILPPMWAWAEVGAVNSAFWMACGINALIFIPGEALACYVLGTLLLKAMSKISYFRPAMQRPVQI